MCTQMIFDIILESKGVWVMVSQVTPSGDEDSLCMLNSIDSGEAVTYSR